MLTPIYDVNIVVLILIDSFEAFSPNDFCNKFTPSKTPAAKTSAAVTLRPNKKICFDMSKFANTK